MLEISFMYDSNSKEPMYIQLYTFLKKEIKSGRISAGEKLPSKRKLSTHLGASINTIQTAYEQLSAEGYINSQFRKGYFVNELDYDVCKDTCHPSVHLPTHAEIENIEYDFSHGKIDLSVFPYAIWKRLTIHTIHKDNGELLLNGDEQGELLLREQNRLYLYQSRGVNCTADQIIIGSGTQYIIQLLCLVLGDNQKIAFENPGFHRTRAVFQNNRMEMIPISLDEYGINIHQLRSHFVKAAYVTPSHQFPIGMIMPITRRLELLQWAEEQQSFIIEDDYDGEFRYKGKPIPSLQGLDKNDRVIYCGTFSKSLLPSLRISYMVLPKQLMATYKRKCSIYKQTVSRLHQHTLYLFMQKGHWNTHLNRVRTLYRKKHQVLMTSLQNHMPDITVLGNYSGLHILLQFSNSYSETALIKKAANARVKVYPSSIYYHNHINKNPAILLGFAGLTCKEIESGLLRLNEAWFSSETK